jgi:hypothetical protein
VSGRSIRRAGTGRESYCERRGTRYPKIYCMLRRVLKSKQADRMLWLTLFFLTLLGVGVALSSASMPRNGNAGLAASLRIRARGESSGRRRPQCRTRARRCHRVRTGTPRRLPHQPPRPKLTRSRKGAATRESARGRAVHDPDRTQSRRYDASLPQRDRQRRPWRDSQSAQPWPECQDADSNAMACNFVPTHACRAENGSSPKTPRMSPAVARSSGTYGPDGCARFGTR